MNFGEATSLFNFLSFLALALENRNGGRLGDTGDNEDHSRWELLLEEGIVVLPANLTEGHAFHPIESASVSRHR